jgi:hypothetical protein
VKIGKEAGSASTPPAEYAPVWCVRVSMSVAELVPAAILRSWIVVETFARDQRSCWPGNRALAARLGTKIRAAQMAIEALEDHGLVERRPMPGNRRSIYLIRRTAEPMAAIEWKALAERADRRAAGRAAVAAVAKAEKRAHRPKIRIVG